MLKYSIMLDTVDETSAICAIKDTITNKKASLKKIEDIKPLADFQKNEIKRLEKFLESLKNKKLIGDSKNKNNLIN